MTKYKQLYIAVNEMMVRLGIDGEISTREPETDAVMNALFEIDGGTYNPEIELTDNPVEP